MNRRIAKLYLVLFAGAFIWHVPAIIFFLAQVLAGFVPGPRKISGALHATRFSDGWSFDDVFVAALLAVGMFGIFVWPKVYCARLAMAAVRRQPIKAGVFCGLAAIVTLVPLGMGLAILVIAALGPVEEYAPLFGVLLLFAVDIMIWVLLCSSDKSEAVPRDSF